MNAKLAKRLRREARELTTGMQAKGYRRIDHKDFRTGKVKASTCVLSPSTRDLYHQLKGKAS